MTFGKSNSEIIFYLIGVGKSRSIQRSLFHPIDLNRDFEEKSMLKLHTYERL